MQCHGAVAPLQVMDGKQYTLVCLCYESNLQDTLSCSHYTLVFCDLFLLAAGAAAAEAAAAG